MEKLYKYGLVLGRFCHEHAEHEKLVNTSIKLCEKSIVLVGSAQESATLRNPFDLETRITVIKKIHPFTEDVLIVRGINDLKNEFNNDVSWGKYLKSEVERHTGGIFADLIIYGNDPVKRTWFEQEDMYETAELFIPRSKNSLSATFVRGLLVINDRSTWEKSTSPFIHKMYEELRAKLFAVPIYTQIYDELNHDLSMDNFMKVYNKFVEIDKKRKLKELSKQ